MDQWYNINLAHQYSPPAHVSSQYHFHSSMSFYCLWNSDSTPGYHCSSSTLLVKRSRALLTLPCKSFLLHDGCSLTVVLCPQAILTNILKDQVSSLDCCNMCSSAQMAQRFVQCLDVTDLICSRSPSPSAPQPNTSWLQPHCLGPSLRRLLNFKVAMGNNKDPGMVLFVSWSWFVWSWSLLHPTAHQIAPKDRIQALSLGTAYLNQVLSLHWMLFQFASVIKTTALFSISPYPLPFPADT